MGTRGALTFVVDGVEKTTYNQYDSYPDGLGLDVLAWLRSADLTAARKAAVALTPVSGEPTADELAELAEFHDRHVSNGHDWYSALRRTQGNPAAILRAGRYDPSDDFPLDLLFCEWAYVVDFDSKVFEVYKGFQQSPPTAGRWVGREGVRGYCPVQRVAEWSFDALPVDLSALDAGDEDES